LIVTFKTRKLEACYQESNRAIRKFGPEVAKRYIGRINIIKAAKDIEELQKLPGLRCHALTGDRVGEWAVNLTGFYRLIFTLRGEALEVAHIEEVSKHYDD
jgi:proteic killer suppression protein